MRLAIVVLLAGCMEPFDVAEEDLHSDDVPDDRGLRLSAAELADEEAAAGELRIADRVEGAYAWDEADAHAARVNRHRTEHGTDEVRRSACLDGVARRWALRMASGICGDDDPICHRASDGPSGLRTQLDRCWQWSAIGENVGVTDSEPRMFQGFLDSPGHHANIDAAWNGGGAGKFGIGAFRRADGRLYITQVFATRY